MASTMFYQRVPLVRLKLLWEQFLKAVSFISFHGDFLYIPKVVKITFSYPCFFVNVVCFFPIWILYYRIFMIYRTAGEGGGYFSTYFLPLPPASYALRHYPSDDCREFTSSHSCRTRTGNLCFPSASR